MLMKATSAQKDLLPWDKPPLPTREKQKLGRVQAGGRKFLGRNMQKGSNSKTRQVSWVRTLEVGQARHTGIR